MLRAEFDSRMNLLMTVYEKRVKEELADLIFDRVKSYDRRDWFVGIRNIIEDPDRRMFPRMGEIMHAVSDAAQERRNYDWNETKHRERQEIDLIMQSVSGNTIRDNNKIKIRKLIEAVEGGPILVNALARDYEEEAETAHECYCEHGLVFYTRSGPDSKPYQHVAACSQCTAGKAQSRGYPCIDPETKTLAG